MSSVHIEKEFNTTAERIAYVFGAQHLGSTVVDLENSSRYVVTATGAGVTSMAALPGTYGYLVVPTNAWRECDANGDVGAITANGGLLASDTTPIKRAAATTEDLEIAWVASNSDIIIAEIPIPEEFDGTQDVLMQAQVQAGTTDAFSATVDTTWAGGTLVVDTLSAADLVATTHQATGTIAAADVADTPDTVTVKITPGAHTTDAWVLKSFRMRYVRTSG